MATLDDLTKEIEDYHAKRFFLLNWIDDGIFKGKNIFDYRPSYILIRPHMIVREIGQEIKWAYQRVVRGWDDRVVWSVDCWLNDIMPEILLQLKNDKVGVPVQMFVGMTHGDNYEYTDEQHDIAKQKWNDELDKMITAFVVAKKLNNLEYDYKDKVQEEILTKLFNQGMDSFKEYYFNLWD